MHCSAATMASSSRSGANNAKSDHGPQHRAEETCPAELNRAVSQKEHGYHGGYCYLPLYIFCGRHLLAAKLRRVNTDASAGSVEELERMATQIRRHWPEVCIVLRADSGFARDTLKERKRRSSESVEMADLGMRAQNINWSETP